MTGFQFFCHAPHVKIVCDELGTLSGHGSQYAITPFIYECELVDVDLAGASLEQLACSLPTGLEFVDLQSREAALQDQAHFGRVFGNGDSQHVSLSLGRMGGDCLLLSESADPLTSLEDGLSDSRALCCIA